MIARVTKLCSAACLAALLSLSASAVTRAADAESAASAGVVTLRSAYPLDETVARLKADIAKKGIVFFAAIDQSQLAAGAHIDLRPSTLLVFGNPALGSLFITANPVAGLDWPVRLLVFEDATGTVWTAYSDFAWIARRHHIENRGDAFNTAAGVIASITASVAAK